MTHWSLYRRKPKSEKWWNDGVWLESLGWTDLKARTTFKRVAREHPDHIYRLKGPGIDETRRGDRVIG